MECSACALNCPLGFFEYEGERLSVPARFSSAAALSPARPTSHRASVHVAVASRPRTSVAARSPTGRIRASRARRSSASLSVRTRRPRARLRTRRLDATKDPRRDVGDHRGVVRLVQQVVVVAEVELELSVGHAGSTARRSGRPARAAAGPFSLMRRAIGAGALASRTRDFSLALERPVDPRRNARTAASSASSSVEASAASSCAIINTARAAQTPRRKKLPRGAAWRHF